MKLTPEEQAFLEGRHGPAAQKAMEILVALGTIYGAERLVPVTSVQIAGVSYDNLGEAGLQFLTEMAAGGGQARVLTTLNPAGMDIENWQALGIDADFAENQRRVIDAFARMRVVTTCSCTPYLFGNLPHFGEHIAWAESSAVCYANSVLGARTNREGGPSALAAALTGPHARNMATTWRQQRRPGMTVEVSAALQGSADFGALGKAIGQKLEAAGQRLVPYVRGVAAASGDDLKAFCASLATYGGAALFHIEGITPEAAQFSPPDLTVAITPADLEAAHRSLNDAEPGRSGFRQPGLPAPFAERDCASGGLAEWPAGDEGVLDHDRAPDQADRRPDGVHGDHRSQRGQVCGGYLLCGGADQRPLQGPGHRQRQSLLLRLRQEQIQDALLAL